MNNDYQKRMMLVFVLALGVMIASFYFMPKSKPPAVSQAPQATQAASAPSQPAAPAPLDEQSSRIKKEVAYGLSGPVREVTLSNETGETVLTVDTYGGRVSRIAINGRWNRKKDPIVLTSPGLTYRTGDLAFGPLETLSLVTNRPVYRVRESAPGKLVLSARANYRGLPVDITKTYTVLPDYRTVLDITLANASGSMVKLDFGGKSLSVAASFEFFPKAQANNSNPLIESYYDGHKVSKALAGGLFKGRDRVTTVTNPRWLTAGDNYFIAAMKPAFDSGGKYLLIREEKAYSEVAFGLEFPPVFLDPGESKTFRVDYYTGPRKEALLKKTDPTLGKLFDWWVVFNWLMKPIEWGTSWLMTALGGFIPNGGLVIILLAVVIKLILSPLSIKSAVSIKRSNILQPKIKMLQEKYKDDPKELNQRIAELYKKEKVNPLGGCLPLLLQIPVFFALYKVLSTSVELKGASFLWIRDLTQPDTLFRMSIPFLPNAFNLLPILMTAIQIIQMQLQSMKGAVNPQQSKINTFLMPVIFLFLFYNMPSGLVLYWTVQSLYTIVEQELINLDKHVRLKS